MTIKPYSSPFGRVGHLNDAEEDAEAFFEVLCLEPTGEDPATRTFEEYYVGVSVHADHNLGQLGFSTLRHLMELGLKMRIHQATGEWPQTTHDLEGLLGMLPADDRLATRLTEADDHLAGFIEELHKIDPRGDAGRYPHLKTSPVQIALEGYCHLSAEDALHYSHLMWEYAESHGLLITLQDASC